MPAKSSSLSLGFIGAGKMATALARGFLNAKIVAPSRLFASDPIKRAAETFARETGARTLATNAEVLKSASVIVLCVKPDQVMPVLADIRTHFSDRHLLVSVAAGVPIARLEGALGEGARIVRVMPNTPALVGACAAGYALNQAATAEDARLAQDLFSSVGVAFPVKESLLDAVTGLSGSGPAYACLFIEALSDGGVAAGLPREVATRLAAQTVLGTARMVLETGLHPGALKDMVTSPGGTTIDGIHELEKGKLRAAVISAVRAAADKARKLGQA